MEKKLVLIGALILFASTGVAQTNSNEDIETVVLASTSNYPDAMISSPVSEKLGYPVLLTEESELPQSADNALEDMDPENIIMIGGPSVLSETVENDASDYGNVTRVWGTTQVGTSVDVAEYFWPEGSEEAVIMQYPVGDEDYDDLMAAVKENADERPVLISTEGELSASVVTSVEDLGVEEAEVYSTNAVNVTEDLESSGVEDVEINSGAREDLEDNLRSQISTEGSEELVIVAAGNFRDTISVPNNPNSASYIVSSESQIDGAVTLVEESDEDTRIKVVGNPDMAQDTASRIENETDREVDQISGEPEKLSANQASESRSRWSQIQDQRADSWRQNAEQNMRNHANRSINRAETAVNENSSEEAQQKLENAKEAFENSNYFEARRMSVEARSEARSAAFQELDDTEVMERVREDQETMREAANEISENNQEMAQEMAEAENEEERREIIQEYREERMSIIAEMRENRRENMEMPEEPDEEEREEENETENPDVTSTRLRVELDGNELEVDGNFVGRTGGYSVDKSLEVENGEITGSFNFIPPSGVATQALAEYESSLETNLEDGNYNLRIELMGDGQVRETMTDSMTVPGEVELESETDGIEAQGPSVELE